MSDALPRVVTLRERGGTGKALRTLPVSLQTTATPRG